jgi:hypothetical protein
MCVAAVTKTLPERVAADNSAGVKATPGTLQAGGANFTTTHWSIVAQSALTNVPESENALAKLCETYWPPIYSLIRRRGYAPADTQYLTQSFFEFFLRNKAYSRADRLHGKFRSSLLACVKYFLSDNASFDIRNSVGRADRDKIAIVARL